MKNLFLLLIPVIAMTSCGGGAKKDDAATKQDSMKLPQVVVTELQPVEFDGTVEIQASVSGDQNVVATPQAPGTVKSITVKVGQRVSQGQVLATLDASTLDRQIASLSPQLTLTKTIYEKQQNLWSQNIGSEVQLLSAKANYESIQKQIEAYKAQRDMYRIVSPISGTVDNIPVKVGDVAQPGNPLSGVRVVNYDQMKVEAMLGENYLGKVKEGDKVTIAFPDQNDSIVTKITYVARQVDPMSRSFNVQVQLKNSPKLHPNMSCVMKIANYHAANAIVVPVGVIQKAENSERVFIAEGNKAKEVKVKTGRISNGRAEITEGLKAGDKLITTGYEDLENGAAISIQ